MVKLVQALVVASILLFLLVATSLAGMDFRKPSNKHVARTVTLEGLTAKTSEPESACAVYGPEPHKLEKYCNTLSDKSCGAISCCVWLSDNTCVAGGPSGPTFHTRGGKDIDMTYYRHRSECVGDCPAL